jgi:hypothetical protein
LTNKIGSRNPPALPNCENIIETIVETILSSFGNQLELTLVLILTTKGIVIEAIVYSKTLIPHYKIPEILMAVPSN